MRKPLAGIKVLELSTFVAAPSCARLLVDLGADVIKVERPEGDNWRVTSKGYSAKHFSDYQNPVFDIYNAGKKLISIDLKNPDGMEAFQKLLAQADVFVTNLRPAALKRLGIFYDDVKEKYPRLIYAIVLGYGEKGPDADKPALDVTAYWSKGGFLRDLSPLNEQYRPINAPSGVADTATGMFLMGEICAALYNRDRTGKGDYVRTGLYHNGVFTMGTMNIIAQKAFGRTYPRSRIDHGSPDGNYQCADGEFVYLATISAAKTLPKLYDMLGRPDLLDDPRFATSAARGQHLAEYFNALQDAFLTKPCNEWLKIAEEKDVPLIRQAHFSDVSEDEQAWANGYLEHVEFANGQVGVMPSSPIEMDSVGELKTVPASLIGADTREILKDLGYTEEQIEKMYASGAVHTQE